ncbi:MAG: hypothetical protein HOP29_10800 [Phycisphaerales bacterium]|nr:hypothetical protein [Phycisphaerales bacterium]
MSSTGDNRAGIPNDGRVDAYCDGQLLEADRVAFERLMAADATLRAEVETQRDIDESLLRLYAAPDADAVLRTVLAEGGHRSAARKRGFAGMTGTRRWAIAAVVALGMVGGWLGVDYWRLHSFDPYKPATVEQVYAYEAATGLKAAWKCENDQQFATTFWKRFNQAMVLAQLPADVEWTGIDYAWCVEAGSLHVMAWVGGEPVIVFASRKEYAIEPTLSPGSKLHLFRREDGLLVLHELTPLDRPRLLDLFRTIAIPDEWKTMPLPGAGG